MSVTSARVGSGLRVIDSSICVATMQALPRCRQSPTSRFWASGTCGRGISTPMSPRATMSPSAAATMPSIRSSAWGLSILAMIHICSGSRLRSSPTSAGR